MKCNWMNPAAAAIFGIVLLSVPLAAAQRDAESDSKAKAKTGEATAPLQDPEAKKDAEPPRKPDAESQAEEKEAKDKKAEEKKSDEKKADSKPAKSDRKRSGLGILVEGGGQQGLSIVKVEEDSVAADAGLKQDDRIISVDGWTFRNPRQLQAYLGNQHGRGVPFLIERDGERQTIQVQMEEPQDGAWLGVYLREPEEEDSDGARVTQVFPGGPAARAGVRPGDVIVKVKDKKVTGPVDLVDAIDELEPKSEAEITVLRDDREMKLTAQLGSRLGMLVRGQGGQGFPDDRGLDLEGLEGFSPFARQDEKFRRLEEALNDLKEEVKLLREKLEKEK